MTNKDAFDIIDRLMTPANAEISFTPSEVYLEPER